MALLVNNDPCDNLTFAPWTTNGTITVVAGGHTGNAFQLNSGSSSRIMYSVPGGSQTDTITIGFWYRPVQFAIGWNLLHFRADAGVTLHGFVQLDVGGGVFYKLGPGSLTATGTTLIINTWYYIEASFKLSDGAGAFTLKVGGTTIASVTGVDTKDAGTASVLDQVWINSVGSTTAWMVDDVYIRNDSTFGVATTEARLAQTHNRALVKGNPAAYVAQTGMRVLVRAPPTAHLVQTSVRALTRIVTEGQMAQISLRALTTLPPPQTKVWNGSGFVTNTAKIVKLWDGAAFVDALAVKVWTGTAFVDAL